jgi:hypothetical protein
LCDPFDPACSGVAFGRAGQYYVALAGGLVTQFYTDPAAFRAVLRHELGHLRNGDVDKTYLAVATWRAFLLTAVIPLGFVLLRSPAGSIIDLGWRVLCLAALVYLSRNAVLRAREFYADARASIWDGEAGALRRVLEVVAPAAQAPRTWRRWRLIGASAVTGPLRVHPDARRRREALDDPQRLFRMGFWEALAAGVATGIAFPSVELLLSLFIPASHASLRSLGAGLLLAPFVVGVVGLGAWRATFATLARGETPHVAVQLGLGIGAGILLGQQLSFVAFAMAKGAPPAPGVSRLTFDALWSILLVAGVLLLLVWLVAGATAWLEVTVSWRSPRPAYTAGLAIAGVLLAAWLGLLFYVSAFRLGIGEGVLETLRQAVVESLGWAPPGIALYALLGLAALGIMVSSPLALPVLGSFWAFPLAAWFWQSRQSEESVPATERTVQWALLGPPEQAAGAVRFPAQAPLRLDLALAAGAVAGASFCAFSYVAFGVVTTMVPDALAVWTLFGQTALAVLMQAIVAAVVAAKAIRLSALHGLCAAFVAGCIMTGGAVALTWLSLGTLVPGFAGTTLTQIVNGGAVVALPVALGVAALTSWGRRRGTVANVRAALQ